MIKLILLALASILAYPILRIWYYIGLWIPIVAFSIFFGTLFYIAR